MKQARDPATIHPPIAGYSHQIEITGERLLLMSGQVGIRPDGSLPQSSLEQYEVALENIERNLQAAGMTVTDLVKATFYIADRDMDTEARRGIFAKTFGEHRPCTTLIYVAGLATPELLVEIDAWATA